VQIACIVEGKGEEQAPPVLIRRIIAELNPPIYPHVFTAVRWPKSRLVQQHHLVEAIGLAVQQAEYPSAVLVLLDADDHCPATLGPQLLGWARAARSDIPIAVTVANREYEAWFLASAESLRGHHGLATDFSPPVEPEAVRGAKERLSSGMPRPYNPTRDQASFSQMIDLEAARRAPSFAKLCRDVRRLVEELQAWTG